MRARHAFIFICILLFWLPLAAEGDKPASLSAEDKRELPDKLKDVQIWTLRVQNAALELEKAKGALEKASSSRTPVGYQIELTPTGDVVLTKKEAK